VRQYCGWRTRSVFSPLRGPLRASSATGDDVKKSFSAYRRGILQGSILGAAAAFVGGVLPASKLHAADVPHVSEDDPMAKGVKYVHDATKSERPDGSQVCHNCMYFKGTASAGWGPCDIFPGKAVNANGWCNVWSKKA
jgi:hypothetical protein